MKTKTVYRFFPGDFLTDRVLESGSLIMEERVGIWTSPASIGHGPAIHGQ